VNALLMALLLGWTPLEDLPSAVAAYREARYSQAAQAFADLALQEHDAVRAAILHANAGTAAARAGQLGEAVWQLRMARNLLPRDETTARNLERVRELLGQGETEARHFTATLLDLPLKLTRHENAALSAALVCLALLLLSLWRAGHASSSLAWTAVALLVLAAAWAPFANAAWERERQRAVVLPDVVIGRAEPDEDAEVLFRLAGGAVVRDEESRRGWRLVQAPAGARGWVPADQVRPLRR
jgi:hypothetical protein